MKSLILFVCALLVAGVSTMWGLSAPSVGASTTGMTAQPPIVVNPGEQKSAGGLTVTNGNYAGDYVSYAGSNGKVRIKNAGAYSGVEVRSDNGFKGEIKGIGMGCSVILGPSSNPVDISGNGGNVSVGSGTTATVKNTGAPGGNSIVCTTPGGSTISIPPGSSVTITG